MAQTHRESEIRRLCAADLPQVARSFGVIGKTGELFGSYLSEQDEERRTVLVALVDGDFAGYITVNWQPTYPPLAAMGAPELQDLNVLPAFRRRGLGTALVGAAELEARSRSSAVGIAVGLHPGYNAAQRLYVRLGYVPDGKGITVNERPVQELQTVVLNDDVVLHFEKTLASIHDG